jgi:hypothetical protein
MMKKFKFLLLLVPFMHSCGPASSGKIIWDSDQSCGKRAILINRSSEKKITFVTEWRWVKDGVPESLKIEETLSPTQEKILACKDDDPSFDIVIIAAYESK